MTGTSRRCFVFRVPMAGPSDVSGIDALFERNDCAPDEVIAVFGKTEGNGCVNDFTRGYAVQSLSHYFAQKLGKTPREIENYIAMIMSGGTEGGLSPHFLVFAISQTDEPPSGTKSLAVGRCATRPFLAEEIGRMAQIEATAASIRKGIASAGIDDPSDVHFVQIKCPLVTSERATAALSRGKTVVTDDTYASMGYSRGASALGVGVALGELELAELSDATISRDCRQWSAKASTSAGIELMRNEIIVLGNSGAWSGPLSIGHAVMEDALDTGAVYDVLASLGLSVQRQLAPEDQVLVKAVLAKAEPSANGLIRGRRHIMGDDSDINATRHARALVGGVLAGVFGHTDLFVSGGAEHQGPDGGGPIAIITERRS